jgi:hypothetical protein
LSTCRHTQGLKLEPTRGSSRLASRHQLNIKPPGQTHALFSFPPPVFYYFFLKTSFCRQLSRGAAGVAQVPACQVCSYLVALAVRARVVDDANARALPSALAPVNPADPVVHPPVHLKG